MSEQFSLIDEPWLVAVDDDGELGLYSIREVFARAGSLSALAGDGPTQDAAVLRLLVAILYRALPVVGDHDERIDRWSSWWEADTLPLPEIDKYLDTHHDRFDLFGDVPFMQVAGLTAKGTSGLRKLIADVPPNEQYFTIRSGASLGRLTLEEAARWLVHTQAFDPSGIKTGAIGDPTAKGGRGYPIGTGWAGSCGLVLLEGATLRETLLLNLVLRVVSGPEDTPLWERKPLGPGPADHAHPGGPADLLTWPSRRVRLIREGGDVVDVLLCNGDKIAQQNRHRIEPHCGWRYSEPQTKKLGHTVYMPRTHDPDRALWRGLPSLLAEDDASVSAAAAPQPSIAPTVVEWLAALVDNEVLPRDHRVTLRAVGVEYGAKSSTIATIVDDSIVLSADVVASPVLRRLACHAAQDAEAAVRVVANLAGNLCLAAGVHDQEGARDAVRRDAYGRLDAGYRRWLAGLTSASDADECRLAWQTFVAHELALLADSLVAAAGPAVWRGREVLTATKTYPLLDAGLTRLWFDGGLAKALPGWAAQKARPHMTQEGS